MANQDNLGDARLASEESHSSPHIESNELPIHRRFVVFESRIHAENAETTPGQFLGRSMGEIVAGAMDGQKCNRRDRTAAWNPVQSLTSATELRELLHHRGLCRSL
jgi:hypothetical protein